MKWGNAAGPRMTEQPSASTGVNVIAIVNGVAACLHIVFWTFALRHLARLPLLETEGQRIDRIVTAGLGVADLAWSAPLLAIGSYWLYRRSFAGWLGAQMANALWWYSYTFLIFRECAMGALRPGTMIFLPFALFSLWSAYYLWRVRASFPLEKAAATEN